MGLCVEHQTVESVAGLSRDVLESSHQIHMRRRARLAYVFNHERHEPASWGYNLVNFIRGSQFQSYPVIESNQEYQRCFAPIISRSFILYFNEVVFLSISFEKTSSTQARPQFYLHKRTHFVLDHKLCSSPCGCVNF